MLLRASQLTPLVRRAITASRSNIHVSASALGGHGDLPSPRERNEYFGVIMDRMPKAEGSWKEQYDRKNRVYNIHIGIQIVIFIAAAYWTCYGAEDPAVFPARGYRYIDNMPVIFNDGTVVDPKKELRNEKLKHFMERDHGVKYD
ncbi:uncharacterized protein LOC106173345 [Lingula anatina]|uniref:Uncharacterized protein LOC106173345 n=1 Tax=Lingula anatina TaxID=7574 RepID=A0A1S3JHM0_LINAN|nr:uncharacterized protein LOC106173345 [Lingula anatina]|eukprot:XP_013409910.1 uncharacterized protein LOC106173345 [Lingula anatina]